ncbi:MAG: hypothetical protein JWQ49_5513 [Edaphobacter sp.]|nr:hypothetical protein [Edaphobacter sp.]
MSKYVLVASGKAMLSQGYDLVRPNSPPGKRSLLAGSHLEDHCFTFNMVPSILYAWTKTL